MHQLSPHHVAERAAPPPGAAQGAKARAALTYWKGRHLVGRICGHATLPERPATERFISGTGIWVRSADGTSWIAAHVSQWNEIAGAYHVIPDHDPHRPFFVGAARIVRRYVGEAAPGVVRPCP